MPHPDSQPSDSVRGPGWPEFPVWGPVGYNPFPGGNLLRPVILPRHQGLGYIHAKPVLKPEQTREATDCPDLLPVCPVPDEEQ